MRFSRCLFGLTFCLLSGLALSATADDLRDGVPSDVYLATYARHNPERDYMQEHYQRVLEAVEDTRIVERFVDAVKDQMSDGDIAEFEEVWESLTTAAEPIKWESLANCTEMVYAQRFGMPTVDHLVLIRPADSGATPTAEGIINLFKLLENASDGEVSLETESVGDATLTWLQPPGPVPFSPCVGVMGDVLIIASRQEIAREAIGLLGNPGAASKFDDARLTDALAHLPEFEDGLTFFDGAQLFGALGGISDFIRQQAGGDEEAERAAALLDEVFDEMDAIDYEITVEYTEGYQNRTASYGKLRSGAQDTVLGQMLLGQEMFEDWSRWVPENATSYSLATGVNLHPLYAWLMKAIPEHFPEAEDGLEQFSLLQEQFDINLDEDILQSFSGESVSITLPPADASPLSGPQSVTFMKCSNPDRIRDLLHRLVDQLQQIQELRAQNISLREVDGLEGFEEIRAGALAMTGTKPVIGFHEGWMVIASHAEAVQTVLDTLEGDGPTLADSEEFQRFNLGVDGTVAAISYTNTGENTRQAAMGLQQMGAMLPVIIGMAGQNGADMTAARPFLEMIPSIGRIVGTLDFYEEQLSVTRPGDEELSYFRESVTLIRAPEEN